MNENNVCQDIVERDGSESSFFFNNCTVAAWKQAKKAIHHPRWVVDEFTDKKTKTRSVADEISSRIGEEWSLEDTERVASDLIGLFRRKWTIGRDVKATASGGQRKAQPISLDDTLNPADILCELVYWFAGNECTTFGPPGKFKYETKAKTYAWLNSVLRRYLKGRYEKWKGEQKGLVRGLLDRGEENGKGA